MRVYSLQDLTVVPLFQIFLDVYSCLYECFRTSGSYIQAGANVWGLPMLRARCSAKTLGFLINIGPDRQNPRTMEIVILMKGGSTASGVSKLQMNAFILICHEK